MDPESTRPSPQEETVATTAPPETDPEPRSKPEPKTSAKPGINKAFLAEDLNVESFGVSRNWILEHVRANRETFIQEITEAGFDLKGEVDVGLSENYLLRFGKVPRQGRQSSTPDSKRPSP